MHYDNMKNAWFNSGIFFNDWFFKCFILKVYNFQENVLCIVPEDVKAVLIDNVPAHLDAD